MDVMDQTGRPMPEGLSLRGQRVMLEVRNTWMRENPTLGAVQRPQPPHNQISSSDRYPSWDTQVMNMRTQDLFNSNFNHRQQDFSPKTCEPITGSHRTPWPPNCIYSSSSTHQSYYSEEQNETSTNKPQPQSRWTPRSKAIATQNSIMLFDDDEELLSSEQLDEIVSQANKAESQRPDYQHPRKIIEYNHRSAMNCYDDDHSMPRPSGNMHEAYEEEDMFASMCSRAESPPFELDSEPCSPTASFVFRPVISGSKSRRTFTDDASQSESQANPFQFKVPQLLQARYPAFNQSCRQQTASEMRHGPGSDVCTSESMILLPLNQARARFEDVRGEDYMVEHEYDDPMDESFLDDGLRAFSRMSPEFHRTNFLNEKGAFPTDVHHDFSHDEQNESRENFSWEPVIEIDDLTDEPDLPQGFDESRNRQRYEPAGKSNEEGYEEAETFQTSPIVSKGVDDVFISTLLYKLNDLAEDIKREDAEKQMMSASLQHNSDENTAGTEISAVANQLYVPAASVESKQDQPPPNFYIFKTPLKRPAPPKCSAEINSKVQKPTPLGDCESNSKLSKQPNKLCESQVNSVDAKKKADESSKENLRHEDFQSVDGKKGQSASDQKSPLRKIPDMFLKKQRAKKNGNAKKNIKLEPASETDKSSAAPVERFTINNLSEKNLAEIETRISTSVLEEITLSIIYKEGFSQLDPPRDCARAMACRPRGLMLSMRVDAVTRFCFLRDADTPWIPVPRLTSFLLFLFSQPCPKMCFDAQALLMYLVDKFGFSQEQVCGDWLLIDPLIGGWLLDPDHPPRDFLALLDKLMGTKNLGRTEGPEGRACQLLVLLSSVTVALRDKLQQMALWTLFIDLEMKLVPILAVMELRGIAVDSRKLREMQTILERRLARIQAQAHSAAGRVFALNSAVQLRVILYDELRLDAAHGLHIKHTAAIGAKSTAEPTLRLLQPLHPLPGLVLQHRQLHKLKATYVDATLQHARAGRVHTSWEQTSCATGRICSSNPNMQTIPKNVITLDPEQEPGASLHGTESICPRAAFVAREGCALVSADFCQVELRMFAHLARDATLLRALRSPGDIFLELATLWLGAGLDESRDREKTKRVVYAVMYGAGAWRLAEFLHVSYKEAAAILDSFLGLVPALRTFPRLVLERCRQHGFLRSISGRARWFPLILSPQPAARAHAERQALNFVIQGSAADVCKAAMLATERRLRENAQLGARLLLQIHDELVWEVPCCHVDRFKDLVVSTMEDTTALCGAMGPLSVRLPVSVSVGRTWGDMH